MEHLSGNVKGPALTNSIVPDAPHWFESRRNCIPSAPGWFQRSRLRRNVYEQPDVTFEMSYKLNGQDGLSQSQDISRSSLLSVAGDNPEARKPFMGSMASRILATAALILVACTVSLQFMGSSGSAHHTVQITGPQKSILRSKRITTSSPVRGTPNSSTAEPDHATSPLLNGRNVLADSNTSSDSPIEKRTANIISVGPAEDVEATSIPTEDRSFLQYDSHAVELETQSFIAKITPPPDPLSQSLSDSHVLSASDRTAKRCAIPRSADSPQGRQLGTQVHWLKSLEAANELARDEQKLVFEMHISGNFEIAGFT